LTARSHYVQHFGSGIHKIPLQSNPLWGVLSWPTKDKKTSYTIFSGNLAPGVSGPSLVLDTHKREFTDEINLHANGISVNLLLIYGQLVKFKTCVSEWLDQSQQPKIKTVKGKTLVLAFQYHV
jgi:hypothetical protein